MNYFDAIFAIAFIWSIYRGLTKGFVIMVATLAALLLGVWGAVHFSSITSELLYRHLNLQTQYLSLISFALTFVLIVIAVHLLARAIDKLLKAVALGWVNRLAGMLFGILKTAFIISIILVLVNNIDKRVPFIQEEHKQGSLLYEPLSKLAPAIFPFLNFNQIRERIEDIDEKKYEV
jgi:membrane protein required for colicin V production